MAEPTKVFLDEDDIPTHWYNIVADFPTPPPPPLHPGTKEPLVPDDLAALFPRGRWPSSARASFSSCRAGRAGAGR